MKFTAIYQNLAVTDWICNLLWEVGLHKNWKLVYNTKKIEDKCATSKYF